MRIIIIIINRNILPKLNRVFRWIHIFSAMPVLISMLIFALTGLLLNHPDWSLGQTKQTEQTIALDPALQTLDWQTQNNQTPLIVLQWLDKQMGIHSVDIEIQWELEEQMLVISLDGPDGTQTIEIYPQDKEIMIFTRKLPFLEMLNNAHRGKHVSGFWRLLSDFSAICMLLFCLSGAWLLAINKLQRQSASFWLSVGTAVLILSIYLMH